MLLMIKFMKWYFGVVIEIDIVFYYKFVNLEYELLLIE